MDFQSFITTVPAGFLALMREYEALRLKWMRAEEENKLLRNIIKEHGLEEVVERRTKVE